MPEGDAVRRTADRLDRALAGQTLQQSDFRVPQLATTDLAGARVGHTATHGKHLLTRVDPLHARKMAAAVQHATACKPDERPVLLWVDRDGGHGAGKPLSLRVREVADERAFVMWQLGMMKE